MKFIAAVLLLLHAIVAHAELVDMTFSGTVTDVTQNAPASIHVAAGDPVTFTVTYDAATPTSSTTPGAFGSVTAQYDFPPGAANASVTVSTKNWQITQPISAYLIYNFFGSSGVQGTICTYRGGTMHFGPGASYNPALVIEFDVTVPQGTPNPLLQSAQLPKSTAELGFLPPAGDSGPVDACNRSTSGIYTAYLTDVAGFFHANIDPITIKIGPNTPSAVQQPQTRPEFQGLHIIPSSLTVTTPLKRNAVVLVHGWNSNPDAWTKSMAEKIRQIIDRRAPPNELWDIMYLDWHIESGDGCSPVGCFPTYPAYVNARALGNRLGQALAPAGYDFVHFIAHSAGSNLIENAATQVKLLSPPAHRPVIHSTFLDAYDPNGNNTSYGFSATFAEHYVDKRFLDLPNTTLKLPGAYNYDITALDFDAIGINPIEAHKWPYRWYQKTVEDVQFSIAGFLNAIESGRGALLSHDLLPKGDECSMTSNFTACLSSTSPTIPVVRSIPVANPFNIWASPGLVTRTQSPTGTVSLTTPQVIELTNNSPVWISLSANIPQGFNTLEIDYQFTSQAEGLLSVFLDDQVIYKADQRQALASVNSSERIATGNITPGPHTLSFRLDHFTPALSAVEISNIRTSNLSIMREVNLTPVADAGKKQKVRLGSLVHLDGSASYDPDKKPLPLTYDWKQVSGPPALLFDPTTASPKFTPITKGHYEFSLIVNDGQSNSKVSTIKVHASQNGDLDENDE